MGRLGPKVEEFFYPWNWLRAAPDIVHLHWPEMPLGHPSPFRARVQLELLLNGIRACKARGARLIWTVHNLDAHEADEEPGNPFRAKLRRRLWSGLHSGLDGWIAHSEVSRTEAVVAHPWLERLPSAVIPHGHFRGEYPDEVSRAEARERLGLRPSDRVLLCFGALRPYRNVSALLDAFRATSGEDLRLLIAGGARDPRLRTEIESMAARDPRVRLDLRHVPTEELQHHFRACDVVVLPYRDILNSGAALLALTFDRPVLLPDKGSMPELQRTVGAEWIRLFRGEILPASLHEAVSWATSTRRSANAPLSGLDWHHLARLTLEFYERVLNAGPQSPG
jgi:glycosyltransferase involved in cell wall biosynthesis